MEAEIIYRLADWDSAGDRALFLMLLDHYSRDVFGGGKPLPAEVAEVLPERWASHAGAFTMLAMRGEAALGMANCLTSFSTFQAKPRINIHDLVVHAESRGQGIGRGLIEAVCEESARRGACQVTLEVLVGNERARRLYEGAGFKGVEWPPQPEGYLFGARQVGERGERGTSF